MSYHLLGARLSAGSNRAYKSGLKMWLKFTNSVNVDPFSRTKDVIKYFVLYRFMWDKCKSQTIKGNLSAVNDYFLKNGKPTCHWNSIVPELPYIYKAIDKILPPGSGSLPNDEKFTLRLKKYYNFHLISDHAYWCQHVWAYTFSMRSCEYSETRSYHPPKLANVKFARTEHGNRCLRYKIPNSKTNQVGQKEVVVSTVCCCPSLCGLCTMAKYLKHRYKINDELPSHLKQHLFIYCKKKRVTINNKYVYLKQYFSINDDAVRANFKKVVTKEFGTNHKHTVHGWRSGGITDLIRLGVPKEIVCAISRHSAQSQVFDHYVKFTADHVASVVKKAKN